MEHKQSKETFVVFGTSSLTEDKTIVLKYDKIFAIFNKYGDIIPFQNSAQGIFYQGTRFLSDFRFLIDGNKPMFLSSNLRERSEMFVADLTNPDIIADHQLKLEKGTIHILRKKILWDSFYYEQFHFHNFGLEEIEFTVELDFDADFDDIFEIRGTHRLKKGVKLPLKSDKDNISIGYVGVDQVERVTHIKIDPEPDRMEGSHMFFSVHLLPGHDYIISATFTFMVGGKKDGKVLDFRKAVKKHKQWFDYIDSNSCEINTSNEQFNHWINRSRTDLITMITNTPFGPYPYAGIPWYDAPFGRDGIITALECLWISPEVSKGVLKYLAATQAKEEDSFRDAEPGKILHEARDGEMAALNEIPFRQYYGTIDATPLFIVLAGAYYIRTGDLKTIREIWDNIEHALDWIDRYGINYHDLFAGYSRKEKSGLFNQGWKDSYDSISYQDGELADLPIALCEVQGYVYDAWLKAALLARAVGFEEKANRLEQRARRMQQKFSENFWSEEKSAFYIALAGTNKPCDVLSSNAGHCLFSAIATPEQARKLSLSLLSEDMFTGWGIRTLGSGEVRYNPMSYHNGSVWPHDNALIAYGFSRYGLKEEVKKITAGLFDASLSDEGRLPELFCGFKRRVGEAPTSYPVACSPQAWSVAAVFILIQALLGMEINEVDNIIRFYRPVLPEYIDRMTIKNLKLRNRKITINIIRTADSVSISSENKNVKIEITF
jgi:glycogen debranching enzyme